MNIKELLEHAERLGVSPKTLVLRYKAAAAEADTRGNARDAKYCRNRMQEIAREIGL